MTRMYRIRDECIRLTRKTAWDEGVERRKSDCRAPWRKTNEDVYGRSERGSGSVSGGVHGAGRG